MGTRVAVAVLAVVWLSGGTAVFAQAGRGRSNEPVVADGVSPAELQRLFDAYVLVQAQDALQLTDAQAGPFLSRFRALQDTRRRQLADRTRIVQDLRRLAERGRAAATAHDAIRERLKALRDLETRNVTEVLQAVDRLDEVLDPVQQARLRVLEEQMERRKLELLLRARQGARARRPLR